MNRAPVRVFARNVLATALASLVAAAVVLACTTGPQAPTPTPDPAASLVFGSTGPSIPPLTIGPPPSPTPPDDAVPLVIDPALLAILPESVDGVAVEEDVDEGAVALSDPALPRIASALDAAVAVNGDNLVLAWVVRLRPDRFTVDAFRQWRDSYDEGACTAAGGVVGHAEAEIGGRTAFVTSCAGALHTYHVWLEEQDILISASSLGQARFGEQLLAGLRVPE